jgi:RNA polymerase sigma-70 factor (ECF subfamily)
MSAVLSSFEQIYAGFHAKVQRYLTRLVGPDEAEDVTQEVFTRINRALPTFRGESQLSTWIYRIARNAALDRLRSPSFKRTTEDGLPDESELGDIASEDADTGTAEAAPSVEEQACRRERYDCYRSFIADLPAGYRAVVALSELEDRAANEIADMLGLSVGVVKIRLHRGRARLLQELKAHCKAEDWL